MVITVDGYDGTGKTTLAKNIAKRYGFTYLEKPVIRMVAVQKGCDLAEAEQIVKEQEHSLWKSNDKHKIAEYYCEAYRFVRELGKHYDIVMDRGLLTLYAIIGDDETKDAFDKYIEEGLFYEGSVYLTATDENRIERIRRRNPNDPDLKRPHWRDNDLEEYADSRHLNYFTVATDDRTPDEVFEEAIKFLDPLLLNRNDRTQNAQNTNISSDDEEETPL